MLLLPKPIREVSRGDRLLEPVFSQNGQLLLDAGEAIGITGLVRLRREGVVRVLVDPTDEKNGTNRYAQENILAQCEKCEAGLALRQPRGQSYCKPYQCEECQEVYFGAFDEECSGAFCGPERVFCDRSVCDHMCEVKLSIQRLVTNFNATCLSEVINEMSGNEYMGPERRRAKRQQLEVYVVVIPLSESYRVLEKPRLARTRDISSSGVSIVSDRGFESAACVIDFQPAGFPDMRLICNVVWEAKRGQTWQIGAAMCGRIDPSVGDLADVCPPQTQG